MVLLTEKFNKFYSKMENFPHHREDYDDAEASISVFRSKVSNFMNETLLKPKPRSGNLSFSWIKRCLELVSVSDKAFAKLVAEMNHPMSKWESVNVEEYLNYTLNMLDLLNLVSSSISHLGHARLELSHALNASKSLSDGLNLKTMEIKIPEVGFRERTQKPGSDPRRRFRSKKERVIHEALVETKSIGFWVCGVVLSALIGDSRFYGEIKKLAFGFSGSSLECLNLSHFEEKIALEEVKNVKEAATAVATVGLKRKLEDVEKGIEEVGAVVDEIFSRTLAGRNRLLGTIRLT